MIDLRDVRRATMIVAHPDDECLWFAGLIMTTPWIRWRVICCSVPTKDPIRAKKFPAACKAMGAAEAICRDLSEGPSVHSILQDLDGLKRYELDAEDLVVTHGPLGEYGHPQHKQVHTWVVTNLTKIAHGTYSKPELATYVVALTPEQWWNQKLVALQCYDHKDRSTLPKWQHLLRFQKTFDLCNEPYVGICLSAPPDQELMPHPEFTERVVDTPRPSLARIRAGIPVKPAPLVPRKTPRPLQRHVRNRVHEERPPDFPTELGITTRARPGLLSPDRALILGGGSCVWEDVKALESLYGRPWDGIVIAANDIGSHWPGPLDHWVSLHPDKFVRWIPDRAARGHPDGYVTWGRKRGMVDHVLNAWAGGSSGMLATQLAIMLHCTKVVLCGIPMNVTPHFAESVEFTNRHKSTWTASAGHWKAWGKTKNRFEPTTRSMSGRTRELLGAPTLEWLMAPPAPLQVSS